MMENNTNNQHPNPAKTRLLPVEFTELNWRFWSFVLILVLGIYLLGLFQSSVSGAIKNYGLTDPWYSPTVLVIPFVGLFRLTCYAYRKDYHRHLFDHPVACELNTRQDKFGRAYTGETRFFRVENFHRYFMYIAVAILPFFFYDFYVSMTYTPGSIILSIGGIIILINAIAVTIYTFSCHSIRHLVGGRMDCFSCTTAHKSGGKVFRFQSIFNRHHEALAWTSLAMFVFVDLYIRAVAAGIIPNLHMVL